MLMCNLMFVSLVNDVTFLTFVQLQVLHVLSTVTINITHNTAYNDMFTNKFSCSLELNFSDSQGFFFFNFVGNLKLYVKLKHALLNLLVLLPVKQRYKGDYLSLTWPFCDCRLTCSQDNTFAVYSTTTI